MLTKEECEKKKEISKEVVEEDALQPETNIFFKFCKTSQCIQIIPFFILVIVVVIILKLQGQSSHLTEYIEKFMTKETCRVEQQKLEIDALKSYFEDLLAEHKTELSTLRQAYAAVIKDPHAQNHQISIDSDSCRSNIQTLQHQSSKLHKTVQEHADDLFAVQEILNKFQKPNDMQEQNSLQIQEYESFQHPENIHHQQTLKQHSNSIWSLATLVQDGSKYFVSVSSDRTMKLWKTADNNCEATLTSSSSIRSLETFTVNGHNYIACGGNRPYDIEIWGVDTKNRIKILKGHSSFIYALLKFQMNGKLYLASGSSDKTIRIWDLLTYHCIATLTGHSGHVYGLSMYEVNGNFFLISASQDKSIKIWNLQYMNEVATLTGHSHWVWPVATYYNNEKIYLASGGGDNTIKIWDLMTHELVMTMIGHSEAVTSLAIFQSGENTFLASGSWDETIKLWNLANNTLISTLSGIESEVVSLLNFHDHENNKSHLISGHSNGEIIIWSE